jgi:excinuclease ABC subunit C
MSLIDKASDQVKELPSKPGVYQFYDLKGDIIYIGKAKNLKKRVASYFTHETRSYKHDVMRRKISKIAYILVENESDAFLLENNLIKEYKPKYNVLLKDDKTFPWICIKNESFPRVLLTRHYMVDGSDYFGPYSSVLMAKTMLELIQSLYKLRTCRLTLNMNSIESHKFSKCLEFHLGNCKGPCEGLQTREDYNLSISHIKDILRGNFQQALNHLKVLMDEHATNLRFEEAESIKQKVKILEKFKSKSTIVNPKISNVDVIYLSNGSEYAYVNFLKIVNGAIVQSHNIEVVNKLKEKKEEILSFIIYDLRERFKSNAKEIIVPFLPDISIPNIQITIPLKGDKMKLLDLSKRNALSYQNDILKSKNKIELTNTGNESLEKLQNDLKLKTIPLHIECFDISNIQGFNSVASCVVFINGKPNKSMYRKFNIKTVMGANDFASIAEVISRRFTRMLMENSDLPNLIVIDGGKGQLNSAVESLKQLNLYPKIAVLGIAKRLEEIYIPDDPVPLYLNKNSSSLRLIQRIRNEAHRFGISFHREKRSSTFLQSELCNIKGIGEKTITRLLVKLPDITKLKVMSLSEIIQIAGKNTGEKLFKYFSEQNSG